MFCGEEHGDLETRPRPAWLTGPAGAHGSGPATLGPPLSQQRKKGQWEKSPPRDTVAQETAWLPPATSRPTRYQRELDSASDPPSGPPSLDSEARVSPLLHVSAPSQKHKAGIPF